MTPFYFLLLFFNSHATVMDPGARPVPNAQVVCGSWQATKHLQPFIRIENALDQVYQEVPGYSSLSRVATGGVKVSW